MRRVQSFFLGIMGAIGALILEVATLVFFAPISSTSEIISREISSPNYLFFLAIFIEEFFKYLLIVRVVSRISEGKNIVMNSLFLGAGFTMLELFSFYWNYRNGINFDPLAVLGIIILHISTAVIIGYFASKNIFPASFFGFFASLAVHSAYNVLGILENPHQKQFIIGLLGLLIFLDIFMIMKPKMLTTKPEV